MTYAFHLVCMFAAGWFGCKWFINRTMVKRMNDVARSACGLLDSMAAENAALRVRLLERVKYEARPN